MAERKPDNVKKVKDVGSGQKQGFNKNQKGEATQYQGKTAEEIERKAAEGGGQTKGGNFENRRYDNSLKDRLKESEETKRSD